MERFWKYRFEHVIFWSATVFFHMFTRVHLIEEAGLFQFILEVLIRNSLLAVVIYTNNLILIPRLIRHKNAVTYIVFLIAILVFYALLKNLHDVYLYGYVMDIDDRRYFFHNTFYNLSIALFYTAFGVALQLSREWYRQREQIRKIEVEKLNTELEYLKSQINPHFLFNSINTIYFQIDKKNSAARDTLSMFSEMLRYQLYECNGHAVPIEREINYLKNYVDLQRLRKDENYKIEFNCETNVKGFAIAPLLLICFVENAFKHVSHFPENNRIDIALNYEDNTFNLRVMNTIDKKQTEQAHTGIGLKNVKRRLELLYPGQHQLNIHENYTGQFQVHLKLTIA
jgi:two-component system, LytTR family, sensor kinase